MAAGLVAAVARAHGARRRSSAPSRSRAGRLATIALIAFAGTGGDLAYVAASHRGALSIVAAIAALYPLTTIMLGRVLRGHRATHLQLIGVAVALTGAVLLGVAGR